jgi:hypothetical protein
LDFTNKEWMKSNIRFGTISIYERGKILMVTIVEEAIWKTLMPNNWLWAYGVNKM